jgi:membrane protein implicated in regulation of membrane protease activity
LLKVAFWLVIIGVAALLAPNPAWPEWLARFVLSLGIAVGVAALALPFVKRGKKTGGEKD